MEFKKALLAGISATALIIAAPAMTNADDAIDDVNDNSDYNSQDINIGSNNGNGGDILKKDAPQPVISRGWGGGGSADGFDDHNAVAVAALQQSSVQVVASENGDAIDDDYEADMDFGSDSFRNQTMNNNNFNSGVNALQGNTMAVAGTADNSFNAGFDEPLPGQ